MHQAINAVREAIHSRIPDMPDVFQEHTGLTEITAQQIAGGEEEHGEQTGEQEKGNAAEMTAHQMIWRHIPPAHAIIAMVAHMELVQTRQLATRAHGEAVQDIVITMQTMHATTALPIDVYRVAGAIRQTHVMNPGTVPAVHVITHPTGQIQEYALRQDAMETDTAHAHLTQQQIMTIRMQTNADGKSSLQTLAQQQDALSLDGQAMIAESSIRHQHHPATITVN